MPRWDENGRPIPDAPQRWDEQGRPITSRALTPAEQAALDYTRRIATVSAMAAKPPPSRTRPQRNERDLRSLILDRPPETRGQRTQREGEAYAATQAGNSGDLQQGLGTGILRGLASMADLGALASGPAGAMGVMNGTGPSGLLEQSGVTYNPTTDAGKLAEGLGMMAPNAITPGSAVARVGAVVIPALAGEGARILTRDAGYDEQSQANMRAGGQFLGALGSGIRFQRPGARPVPVNRNAPFDSRGIRAATRGLTPAKLKEEADRLRALGLEPTLTDVTDEAGRGVIRSAASRQTPARQRVQDFAAGRAENLPDRMGRQARRIMSDDPRTPAEIAADLGARRAAQAAEQFGAVRGEPVGTLGEIDHPYVAAAVREAAMRERDPAVREALAALKPGDTITVGMADRISRVLGGQAEAASRAGDNDLAATFRQLADGIRGPTRAVVPAYGQALDNYAAQSRLMGAADRGQDFLSRNTDEFVADLQGLGPEGLPLARATARRAIERAAGENVSAAPGVARRLALAPEQQARNRALLGEADATRLQDAMRAEERAVANARFIAPNTGSQTQLRMSDAADIADEFIGAGANLMTGNKVAIMTRVARWATERGMGDGDAQLLAEAAIDPARLPGIIADMEARSPRLAAELKLMIGRAMPAAGLSATALSPAPPQGREQRR